MNRKKYISFVFTLFIILSFVIGCSSDSQVINSESAEISEDDESDLMAINTEEIDSIYPIGDLDYDDVKVEIKNDVYEPSEEDGLQMLSMDIPFFEGSSKTACGSGWSAYLVPDGSLIELITSANTYQNFEQACINHDNCYGTCGKTQKQCDDQFLRDLKKGCDKTYGTIMCILNFMGCGACYAQAELYEEAVSAFGDDAFENSQANACATKYKLHYYQYDGVCIYNQTDWELNYNIKWGSGSWKKNKLKPGYRTMHWSYTEKGETPDVPFIRFDADLSSGNYQQDFRLETSKFQIQPSGKSCSEDRRGSYFFAPADDNWLGLYPFNN